MIKTIQNLRDIVNSIIKVIPNNQPQKTQAADVKQYLLDNLDSVEDLVKQLGLSIASTISTLAKKTDIPDVSIYQLSSTAFNGDYSSLINKPSIPTIPDLTPYAKKTDIPTYDFSVYQKVSDTIAYNRITGVPVAFSGNYSDLTGKPSLVTSYLQLTDRPNLFSGNYTDLLNKPVLFDGSWTSLSNKPTLVTSYSQLTGLPTLFNGDYNSLINKPTIPTYDLSLYRLKTDTIDYNSLINKPTIITDYTQLANRPVISKLLWNQLSGVMVTNTVTETNSLILANGNGSLNIDISPSIGTAYRLTGRGLFSIQSVTSPSLTIKLYAGSTLIASGTSSSLLIGANNKSFSFGCDIMITGSTSVYAQGFFAYYAGITDALSSTPLINPSGGSTSTTIDLSIINQLKLTFTWGTASTSNQIQIKIANLEKLN